MAYRPYIPPSPLEMLIKENPFVQALANDEHGRWMQLRHPAPNFSDKSAAAKAAQMAHTAKNRSSAAYIQRCIDQACEGRGLKATPTPHQRKQLSHGEREELQTCARRAINTYLKLADEARKRLIIDTGVIPDAPWAAKPKPAAKSRVTQGPDSTMSAADSALAGLLD